MKAALEAWGADSNLFHQGAAKESDDPDVIVLIDIVSDAAAIEGASGKTDTRMLKRDAFRAILDAEEHQLQDKDLIFQMKSEVIKL